MAVYWFACLRRRPPIFVGDDKSEGELVSELARLLVLSDAIFKINQGAQSHHLLAESRAEAVQSCVLWR